MPNPIAAAELRACPQTGQAFSPDAERLLRLRLRTRRQGRMRRIHCELRAATLRQILAAFETSLSEWLRRDFDVEFRRGFPSPARLCARVLPARHSARQMKIFSDDDNLSPNL